MKLYYKGELVQFNIDDKLPVDSKNMEINSKMSLNDAWWMPILEKAFAKMNVNYLHLNGGVQSQALRTLTGMPIAQYKSAKQTDEDMWSTIYEANQKDYIMTATCTSAIHGLTAGHAYTVYSAVMVDDDGKQVKLIQVRNPWGLEGYNGEWSDGDSRWTKDLREKLGAADKNDGFFFMPFSIFKEAFSSY